MGWYFISLFLGGSGEVNYWWLCYDGISMVVTCDWCFFIGGIVI